MQPIRSLGIVISCVCALLAGAGLARPNVVIPACPNCWAVGPEGKQTWPVRLAMPPGAKFENYICTGFLVITEHTTNEEQNMQAKWHHMQVRNLEKVNFGCIG